MADSRKGWLTPEQEKTADDLYEGKGLIEIVDRKIIQLADNKGGEAIKKKIVAKWGEEILDDIYPVIDIIFEGLADIVAARKKADV